MNTKIEIYRNGAWRELRLENTTTVKYNKVINKINNISSREISHTNTFSLPNVGQNIQALNINLFNKSDLAKTLNSKFKAKYYIDDKLFQEGYLIINNTLGGTINVNFIDEALALVEKWGELTYYDLLNDTTIEKPTSYQSSIDEMMNYTIDSSVTLVPTSLVSGETFKLAEFPNNLNAIGDLFQQTSLENRVPIDKFNSYQSRPVFNMKAFLNIICKTFDYQPIFSNSIDWDKVEKTFMVEKGLDEAIIESSSITTINHEEVSSDTFYWREEVDGYSNFNDFSFSSSENTSKKLTDILNSTEISNLTMPTNYPTIPDNSYNIFIPNLANSYGTLHLTTNYTTGSGASLAGFAQEIKVITIWKGITTNSILTRECNFTDNSISNFIDLTISKTEFEIRPTGATEFVGMFVVVKSRVEYYDNNFQVKFTNLNNTETILNTSDISYDEFAQYNSGVVNLLQAAPKTTIKKLFSAFMQKEGILINIDSKNKEVELFSYGQYEVNKNLGNYYNWSNYLQEYSLINYNTDYGTSYAKSNIIGLTNPYSGNSYTLELSNQGEDSKLKDSATNYVPTFNDVSKIQAVSGTNPYFEYTLTNLGLVEQGNSITGLTQIRADSSTQQSITSLAAFQNVNYSTIPEGVKEWYKIVDNAVKVTATFLLKPDIIKNINLSYPIFVEGLGGYYIIEEIAAYTNERTPVEIKLIKLIDNLITQ